MTTTAASMGRDPCMPTRLTVTGSGRLSDARVTVYNRLEVSGNGSTGTAHFQPRYIDNVAMNVSGGSVPVTMAAGTGPSGISDKGQQHPWPSRARACAQRLWARDGGSGAGSPRRAVAASDRSAPSDAGAERQCHHQRLSAGHYLKTFRHQSTSEISFYFRGGSHWIDRLELGRNDDLIFGRHRRPALHQERSGPDDQTVNAIGKANDLMFLPLRQRLPHERQYQAQRHPLCRRRVT